MAHLTKGAKLILAAGAAGGLLFGAKFAMDKGLIPSPFKKSVKVDEVRLPDAAPDSPLTATHDAAPVALPSTSRASVSGPEVRMQIWAWNAQAGLLFATGGSETTKGSLMEKHGVNLVLTRQDDVAQMQNSLVAFATALKGGERNPKEGVHFVGIMGDGAAAFFAGVNPTLKKLGNEFTAEVVGSTGYSRGEDKFMGPQEWKSDPKSSKGGVVAGYLRDGDWNIAQFWLGKNDLCNNPDEKTYDPDCLNWVAADSYIDASQKYIAGYCEERKVVKNGRPTGDKKNVCVQGVVTWTPGDVMVAEQKGGIVSILSTKENRSQMPHVVIGIRAWDRANRDVVAHFLAAAFEGGDQVKSNPKAFQKAAAISAVVYNEKDPEYWAKYFHVVTEKDKQGLTVELGGSAVNNLADNEQLFGLANGSTNRFKATYETFGDVVVKQYKELVPSYPPVTEILDTSYVKLAAGLIDTKTTADTVTFNQGTRIAETIGKQSWTINFRSGSAEFDGSTLSTMEKLAKELAIAEGTAVEVHGHTDADGDDMANLTLSQKRARAVQEWLTSRSSSAFPTNRFAKVQGHGEDEPVADNNSTTGKAKNRRVDIVIGTVR